MTKKPFRRYVPAEKRQTWRYQQYRGNWSFIALLRAGFHKQRNATYNATHQIRRIRNATQELETHFNSCVALPYVALRCLWTPALSPRRKVKAAALRNDDVHLFVCLFVCRLTYWRGVRSHHGCHRCFSPVRNSPPAREIFVSDGGYSGARKRATLVCNSFSVDHRDEC